MDNFTVINKFVIKHEERLQAISKEFNVNIEYVSEITELFCEINLITDLSDIERNYSRIEDLADGDLELISAINRLVGEEF